MMTRSNLARRTEEQLRVALQELKDSKEQCQQLLIERDDSEKEMLLILQKNADLKSELNQLNQKYENICEHNLELQSVVDSFDNCRLEYEQSLEATCYLKKKLQDSQEYIRSLENQLNSQKSAETQSLYNELLGSVKDSSKNNTFTIDLTGDDTIASCHIIKSKNKFKKYVKIKKHIKKTQKLLQKNMKLVKQLKNMSKNKISIQNQLISCSRELENTRFNYEADVCSLQSEIAELHSSLTQIKLKYELAQKEITAHISAVNDLIELGHYNEERVNSLINNNCQCTGSMCHLQQESDLPIVSSEARAHTESSRKYNNRSTLSSEAGLISIYCDEIGHGVGVYLNNLCMGQQVTSTCLPGATYEQIISRAVNATYCPNTTLVILVGRRGKINKKQLTDYIDILVNKKNVRKLILFTFPCIKKLPHENNENNIRFKLNSLLSSATNQNSIVLCNNQPEIDVVDINNIFNIRYSNFVKISTCIC